MIRIAAVGDVHYDKNSAGRMKAHLQRLHEQADILLLAGDLTQVGTREEISALADDLEECLVPIVAVLGNHDYQSDQQADLVRILQSAGVTVLEHAAASFTIKNQKVGVVGLKGFGGGFMGACATDFGEPEMKSFVRTSKTHADFLRVTLDALDTDYRVVLMHYSPCPETLLGEKKEIYPFLGSYLFSEAIDRAGADIVFHGHAHHGVEQGKTPGGVPVRNVAQPVIRHAFHVYCLNKEGLQERGRLDQML